MTDDDAWEDHCARQDGPPVTCSLCARVFDPTDAGEIAAHRDEHWEEWLRSQCPIPPPPYEPLPKFVMVEEDEEVPF
jgi:hypothetical protein